MREFGAGVGMLFRGLGMWRRIPRAMSLGIVPAFIVAVAFSAALIAFAFAVPGIADALTPFADTWESPWATVVRVVVGLATFGAALLLAAVSFTAVVLIVGDPFYERIWRAVEQETEGAVPAFESGFWRTVGDSIRLLAKGALGALLAWLLGLIPVVGGLIGLVVGVTITGWLLAEELTSRALTARGLDRKAQSSLRRRARGRIVGFGVATQLCFLVPLGAVVAMPVAVAGSTLLAQSLIPADARRTGLSSASSAQRPSSPER